MKNSQEERNICIDALWDDSAKVWSASSKDTFGLFVEGETIDQLLEQIPVVFKDLQTAKDPLADTVVFHINCQKESHFFRQCDLRVEPDPTRLTA